MKVDTAKMNLNADDFLGNPTFCRTNMCGQRHILVDVRNDPTWGIVAAVESIFNASGELSTVVNYLDFDKAIGPYSKKSVNNMHG